MDHAQCNGYKLTLHLGLHGALTVRWMRNSEYSQNAVIALGNRIRRLVLCQNVMVVFRRFLYSGWTNHAGIFTGDSMYTWRGHDTFTLSSFNQSKTCFKVFIMRNSAMFKIFYTWLTFIDSVWSCAVCTVHIRYLIAQSINAVMYMYLQAWFQGTMHKIVSAFSHIFLFYNWLWLKIMCAAPMLKP